MKLLSNIKLRVKLIGGFVIVALLIAIVAFVSYVNMKQN